MQSQWKSNLIVGIFVVGVLGIFLYFIMNYTNELGLFEARAYIHTKFFKPTGLFRGSSVQLNNVKIGKITEIRFPSDLNDTSVHITMIINAASLIRIGQDATASIERAGLLGDSLINIDPGNPRKTYIKDGDYIKGKEMGGLFGGLDVEALGKKLDNILDKIDKGGIEAISSSIQNVSDITAQIKSGKGSLGKIIYDDKLISEIDNTVADLNKIVKRVNQGPGSIHSLVYGDDLGKVLADLKKLTGNLNEMVGQIKDKDLAKKVGELADNLNRTSQSLAAVAKSIENGQGTIGALIQDPSLYDDLKVILGGAKRSDALKFGVQHTIRAKQREQEKEKKKNPKHPTNPQSNAPSSSSPPPSGGASQ